MLVPGSENKKIIDILITITRIDSKPIVNAIIDHYVVGLPVCECADKHNVQSTNVFRAKRRIEIVDNYYDQIMRLRLGLK